MSWRGVPRRMQGIPGGRAGLRRPRADDPRHRRGGSLRVAAGAGQSAGPSRGVMRIIPPAAAVDSVIPTSRVCIASSLTHVGAGARRRSLKAANRPGRTRPRSPDMR
jgi:hypothetical protein